MWRTAAIVLAAIGAASAPATVEAATYKVCVRVVVQTTDTGLSVNGVIEDHYLGTDAPAGLEVIGRGFRVMLLQQEADGSVWADVFDSSTSDGCFSFSRGGSNVYSVVVQGYATDGEDNHVRIHTGGTDTSTWFPGETLDRSYVNQELGSENYFVINGAEDDRWTTIAVAAFGLYRWDNGTNDTIISIGFSEDEDDGCGDSSSMYGDSTSYIESRRAHLIKIGHCGTTDQTESRKKMLVTHELGHAMARLYYGHDGAESPLYMYYVPFGFDETDPNYDECVNTLGYNLTSLEANSLAFKEGFADFYSARVWNNATGARDVSAFRNTGGSRGLGRRRRHEHAGRLHVERLRQCGDWRQHTLGLPPLLLGLAHDRRVRERGQPARHAGALPAGARERSHRGIPADQLELRRCPSQRGRDEWRGAVGMPDWPGVHLPGTQQRRMTVPVEEPGRGEGDQRCR